jgi:predicted DCC family thiol-disulfide oxidoreductase YuxK
MVRPSSKQIERTLLYDGDCGFCKRWCEWAIHRGAASTIAFQPCQGAVELRERAGIVESECDKAALLVEQIDGRPSRVRRGADAVNTVLRSLPGARNAPWRLISALYWIPGIQQLEEWAYRRVAARRGGLGDACRK